jgi:hypothetical protein
MHYFSITMTCDIYGHGLPGIGKKDLEGTLRGEKGKPARTLKVAGKGGG